jgi:hypothetical protein
MNILDEEEFHQEILVTPIFNIRAFPHAFQACNFFSKFRSLIRKLSLLV